MTDRKALLGDVDRVVVKVGTSSITMGGETASSEFMDSIAMQIKVLRDMGKEVLIVTSGAIGIGLKAMNVKPNPKDMPIRQAAASVGQSILMQKWNDSFQRFGIVVAQILITLDDYSDRETVLNLNNTIDTLLDNKVVPIFNENDAICVKELGPVFGDNDTLSAVVASRVDADLLIIVSDVSGLYDKNPKIFPDAKLISSVFEIDDEIRQASGNAISRVGTGGMKTKISAAEICMDAGCRMLIVPNDMDDVLLKAVDGKDIGTIFVNDNRVTKKRRWMKAAHAAGAIVIDEGALKALESHRSLLPVGVKEVRGYFSKGEVVEIICRDEVVAKGIPSYSSDEVSRIRGIQSERILDILGKRTCNDVVLSENIVMLR